MIKRDDCTGLGLGGNKVRKLEFLLADAMKEGADVLVTHGGLQSNHVRQTAAACAREGLGCVAILSSPFSAPNQDYRRSGNVLLDHLFGADIRILPRGADVESALVDAVAEVRAAGHTPYSVPLGGSVALGCLGYVAAASELAAQAHDQGIRIDHVVLPTGSCGTHAGLLLGLRLAGEQGRVLGISVLGPQAEQERCVAELVDVTAALLELENPLVEGDVVVDANYLGEGYGRPTDAMIEAVKIVANLEGILLDPVYTGKAMAGMIDLVRQGRFGASETVVFLHTGGTPALYGYRNIFRSDEKEERD